MSESEDTIQQFMADLASEPEAGAYLREELHQEAVNFLRLCVLCARNIELMDDVYKARNVMLDVTIWARELSKRYVKETAVKGRAKNTSDAFTR